MTKFDRNKKWSNFFLIKISKLKNQKMVKILFRIKFQKWQKSAEIEKMTKFLFWIKYKKNGKH